MDADESVGDDAAADARGADGVADHAAADALERRVHAFRHDRAHAGGEAGGARPLDRNGPERTDPVVVAHGRRADRADPGPARELEEGRADAAVGRRDERRAPRPEARRAVQHLVRGHVVEHDRDRHPVLDAVGDGHEVLRAPRQVLRVATVDGERRHALADAEVGDAGSHGIHHADDLVAGDEWHARGVEVAAPAHEDVGGSDAAGGDANARLPRRRLAQGELHGLEDVRASRSSQHHGAVGVHAGPNIP
jgi:hypothetical protein